MAKVNYHMHTTGSDGELDAESLIKLAIERGFDKIAITDHYFHPPGFTNWGNDLYPDGHYDLLVNLREKYKDKINVLVGVEFDWISKYQNWIIKEVKKKRYDFKIVSVHFIRFGENYAPIEVNDNLFSDSVQNFGGIKNVVKNYYSDLREAINTGLFDSVGHMDIIKMWNSNSKYYSQNEEWYKKEVMNTLKLISKMSMKIDLNTSGWRKSTGEQYPSEWIIKEAKKLGIELLIGTDCHRREHIEMGLREVDLLLKSIE